MHSCFLPFFGRTAERTRLKHGRKRTKLISRHTFVIVHSPLKKSTTFVPYRLTGGMSEPSTESFNLKLNKSTERKPTGDYMVLVKITVFPVRRISGDISVPKLRQNKHDRSEKHQQKKKHEKEKHRKKLEILKYLSNFHMRTKM